MKRQLVLAIAACSLFGAALLSSCSGGSLDSDLQAVRNVGSYSAKLQSGRKLSSEEFENLKSIHDKFPDDERVSALFRQALIQREDWASLKQILAAGDGPTSEEDLLLLGKVYSKLGDYENARNTFTRMQSPIDAERASMLSSAYFHTGEIDKAEATLDGSWKAIVDGQVVDGLILRGLLYFYKGENEKAVEVLTSVLEIDPRSIPAHNALSRVYSKMGDTEKAASHAKSVEDAYRAMTEETKMRGRMMDRMMSLKEAYDSGRHEEVIRLSKELLETADPNAKLAIYNFLAASYRALGRNAEAEEALKQARQLTVK